MIRLFEGYLVMAVCEDSHYTGSWCSGSMAVSKTVDGGSNPPGSAAILLHIYINVLKKGTGSSEESDWY